MIQANKFNITNRIELFVNLKSAKFTKSNIYQTREESQIELILIKSNRTKMSSVGLIFSPNET